MQDADLEYDPDEYPVLLAPIQDGKADVVYGLSREGGLKKKKRAGGNPGPFCWDLSTAQEQPTELPQFRHL